MPKLSGTLVPRYLCIALSWLICVRIAPATLKARYYAAQRRYPKMRNKRSTDPPICSISGQKASKAAAIISAHQGFFKYC